MPPVQRGGDVSGIRPPALRNSHQVAGVGFYHQPNFPSRLELKRIPRRQREMDFHLHSAIHFRHHNHVALRQRDYPAWNNVAGAQAAGLNRSQQDISAPIPIRNAEPTSARTSGVSSSTLPADSWHTMVPRSS